MLNLTDGMSGFVELYVTVNPEFARDRTRLLQKFVDDIEMFENLGVLPGEADDLVMDPVSRDVVYIRCTPLYREALIRRIYLNHNYKIHVPGTRGRKMNFMFEVYDIRG